MIHFMLYIDYIIYYQYYHIRPHSKHNNYDVLITLLFLYYIIITLSLRNMWGSHHMSHNNELYVI